MYLLKMFSSFLLRDSMSTFQ